MNNSKPKLVYKYHRINDHLYDLLKKYQLWFAHQNELNDPFDCKYSFTDDFLLSRLKNSSSKLLTAIKEKTPIFNGFTDDAFFEHLLPMIKGQDFMNKYYNMIFGEIGWNLCCFTTNPMNELMWAFYADNGKGVCLEFDLSSTPELYEKLHPVKYDDTFPEINSLDDLPEVLLTKRTAWKYENEFRVISNLRGHKSFNKESLKAIYFGLNVDELTINNIRKEMIESGYEQVEFKQIDLQIKGTTIKPVDIFKYPK